MYRRRTTAGGPSSPGSPRQQQSTHTSRQRLRRLRTIGWGWRSTSNGYTQFDASVFAMIARAGTRSSVCPHTAATEAAAKKRSLRESLEAVNGGSLAAAWAKGGTWIPTTAGSSLDSND